MSKEENVKHTLIQTLMSRACMTKGDYENLLKPHNLDAGEFFKEVNRLLSPLGLELRSITSDYDDQAYYGVCQQYEDSNASEGLGLKADVVQLFYKFLDLIVNKEEKGVSTIDIGSLLDQADGMLASQAQEAIQRLAKMSYIDITGDRIRLGPRGILEFRPTFWQMDRNETGLLHHCAICLDIALAGLKCPRCETYVHRRCISAESVQGKCPHCQCPEPFVEFGM